MSPGEITCHLTKLPLLRNADRPDVSVQIRRGAHPPPAFGVRRFSLKSLNRYDRSFHQTSTDIFILKNSAKAQHLYK